MDDPDTVQRETWLVLRSQSGDREALDLLLASVQEPLARYLRRLFGRREDAEDALQEVFVRICRKLRWLREPRLFRPWAYRIASRLAFRRLRRERRRPEIAVERSMLTEAADERAEPANSLEGELLARLPDLIGALPPASRAVILLHYMEEMRLAEAADVLSIPLGTAKSRLAYGLRALRAAVARDPDARPVSGERDGSRSS